MATDYIVNGLDSKEKDFIFNNKLLEDKIVLLPTH